ncbi:CocE/NonD family hydrolase [Streptomyces sp. WAC07061]|uniref:CocE/NonD family hydrolase n=1 Tax=Streptomyces sp. WAC07061 TaxID=2487410 RepID=UPI000F7675B4|nr:CocE/NonD family hydrolase [Streptomyces sp. WAC07061]RSS52325.1 CocE/NonD family hydrolase [Streptomyces sp. WAC07061]
MTSAQTPSVTEATLTDIATNGIWGPGHSVSEAVVDVSRALLASLQGEEGVELPAELSELVAAVRRIATITLPRITAHDGVQLSSLSIKLKGDAPRPVVIVPAGWNPYGWLPFLYAYLKLAQRGYHVLAYSPRGIGIKGWLSTSEGFVQVAGPDDWADGSSVIDYAQETLEPSRIGFLGESYGSGISQLVAAHDPADRVDAVVALSTWGNLATSLYDNGTRHLAAVEALIAFTGGPLEEKFDEGTQRLLKDFLSGRNLDEVVEWGTARSPETYVDQTNARGIPTFISNTWHETLFPVNPVLDHFERLTVPKRLNLWIGDHGAPEGPGLAGLVAGLPFPGLAEPTLEAYAWLDHHLLGADNDVPNWPAVKSQSMFTYKTIAIPGGSNLITVPAHRETYDSWSEAATGRESWYLTGTGGSGDGALTDKPTSGWSRDFEAGALTSSRAGELLKTGQREWFGNPNAYVLADFERAQLLVWSTDPLTGPGEVARKIRGTATVRLSVRSSVDAATVIAYLYDVAPDGTARIITHEPYTATGLTPNAETTLTWSLQAASYDLPAGHRLALVVNSRDPLYSYAGSDLPALTTTTVGSVSGSEARLELPLS